MTNKTAIMAAVLAVFAAPVVAQGITGGQLGIEYAAPFDGTDLGGTSYNAAIEYAITRQFSVSADFSSYSIEAFEENSSSLTLHGIFHMDDNASLGVFIGQDREGDSGGDARLYGLEGGTEFMGGEVSGYAAFIDGASDGTMFGLDGAYGWRDGISFTGNASILNQDDSNIRRVAIGGAYAMAEGPEFYGELGNLAAEDGSISSNQAFIGLGARINFGAQRGTTFKERSLFETAAGF